MSVAPGSVPADELGVVALGRRSVTYALGGLAYKGLALLSVPLLARLLSPAELGLVDLAAVLAGIIGLVAGLGADQGLAYLDAREPRSGRVWGSALAAVLVAGVAAASVTLLLSGPLAEGLTGDAGGRDLVVAAGAYGAVLALTSVALVAVRLHASPSTYAGVSFLIVGAEMTGAIAVAAVIDRPVVPIVAAWAAASGVVGALVLARYIPRLEAPTLARVRTIVAFGLPLVPAAAAWLVGDAWIRGALATSGGLELLGQYGIAYRVASVIGLAVTGFGVAWYPYLYRSRAEDVAPRASRILAYLVAGLSLPAVVLSVLAPELVVLVGGPPYADGADSVVGLAGGMLAFGVFTLVSAVVGASGSTRRVGAAALVGAGVQAAAAAPLVAGLGLAGAGAASMLGYLAAAVLLLATEGRLVASSSGLRFIAMATLAAVMLVAAQAGLDWPLAQRSVLLAGLIAILGLTVLVMRAAERGQRVADR